MIRVTALNTTLISATPTKAAAPIRGRNRWAERIAHALPYVLFAAAMLLLDSIGRAATQEEFLKSLHQSVNQGPIGEGGITARGFTLFLGIVGLPIAILVLGNRIQRRRAAGGGKLGSRGATSRGSPPLSSPTSINQPRKLIREIAKAAGLSRDELRRLKTVADKHGHVSPLTLLICPSLLIDAARKDDTSADKAVLARVARRLIEN
ncbi:MAG TPA: hypothetical protein VGR35_22220 [Tepidisphaeraceae bacterium]|nr:hypothetical protein [Tepidisphaeraceae bacterium]